MISIIVPVYNAEKYIETTIEMVCRQTYPDWELILVDDCSRDKSVEKIRECIRKMEMLESGNRTLRTLCGEEKIRLIQKPKNEGAAKARNTGIDAANGRYIAFLDADDVWYPQKLEKQMAFLEKHGAAFVFSAYEFGDENAVPTGKAVHVPRLLHYKEALSRTVIFTSTVLLDTQKTGKELIHMPAIGSEDTATWWNILKAGFVAHGLDESLAIYRRPAQSLSSDKGVAVKRIWNLYRTVAELSVPAAAFYLFRWAWRASIRRLVADTVRNHAEAVKRFVVLELSFFGILVQTAAFAWMWFGYYYPLVSSYRVSQEGFDYGTGLKLYFRGHLLVLAIYMVVLLCLTRMSGGTKTGYLKPGNIFASQTTSLVLTNVISYFQISLMRNWLLPADGMLAMTLMQTAFAGLWAFATDKIFRLVFPPIETLAIEGEKDIRPVLRAFETRGDRFQVLRTLHLKDNLEEIKEECLLWYGAVILGPMEEATRRELLEFCYSHYIRVYLMPDVADILMQGTEPMELFDMPLLELREYPISWEMRVLKRIADVVVSAALLLLFSPVILCRAVYGKLKYGRVMETQRCVTKSNKEFDLHFFATGMDGIQDSADENSCWDKSRISRLPMLWDVLRGKMSLVGPRPLSGKRMEELLEQDPRYFYRLRVRAGLTGYAQVYGKKTTAAEELFKLDLIYIQHFSGLLDLKLLLLAAGSKRNRD
ncbi:MAG: glycosyltransferase [Firmicutes bacterium]|nr:glycosyltransferase [Bacillota bacterium]